ncbi:MAG: aminotransferase class IV [Ferruginibacter sp.]
MQSKPADYFIFNGKLERITSPVLSASTRGLRYGDGLFETIRYANDQLHLIHEHLHRLWCGMEAFQFDLPSLFTPETIIRDIELLLQKNRHRRARIRVTVFRGDGGLYDPVSHRPQVIIESWALPAYSNLAPQHGLWVGIYRDLRKSTDPINNFKHNNCLPYVLGARYAQTNRLNDALILNTNNQLCDSTIANLFLLKNNTLYTPALSEGCVAGVFRKTLIDCLRSTDWAVVEKPISIDEALAADELFLTNAIRLIRPVQQLEDRSYPCTILPLVEERIRQTKPDLFC